MGNTKEDWQTTARVHNPERIDFWKGIFDGDRVPIKSFVAQSAHLPGFDEPQMIYELDLKAITDEQREKLIQAIAQKFDMPVATVADELDIHGVPILADDVVVSSSDRALVMGAIL